MYTNKGMYLEKLLDNTVNFYAENENIFFARYNTKNVFTRTKKFIYVSNNFVDYFGYFKHELFLIEAKQNNQDLFNLKRINDKQKEVLAKLTMLGAKCFVLIYFNEHDEFYLLPYGYVLDQIKQNKKSMRYEEIKLHAFLLEIVLPGILNIKQVLDAIII